MGSPATDDAKETYSYLFSNDRHDEYLQLDRSTRKLKVEPGDPLAKGVPLSGVFGRMDIGPVGLYRDSVGLHLISEPFMVRLAESMSAEVVPGGPERRTLRLTEGEAFRLELSYQATPRWSSEQERVTDFTWTEEEDFDFGLFVANTVNDKNKLKSFYLD